MNSHPSLTPMIDDPCERIWAHPYPRSQVFRFSPSHLWLILHASEVNHWEIQSCLMPCGSSLLPSFSVCPPEGGATGAKSKLRLSPPASGQAQCLHRWGHTWHKKADRGPLSFHCVHFLQKCGQMCHSSSQLSSPLPTLAFYCITRIWLKYAKVKWLLGGWTLSKASDW